MKLTKGFMKTLISNFVLLIIMAVIASSIPVHSSLITWDKIPDVLGYHLNYDIVDCKSPCNPVDRTKYKVDVGDTDSYFLDDDINFQRDKCYRLQVSAYNKYVEGNLSQDVVCTDDVNLEITNVKKKR